MRKALLPDPNLRYSDAGQMAAELESLVPSLRSVTQPLRATSVKTEIEGLGAALLRSVASAEPAKVETETRRSAPTSMI